MLLLALGGDEQGYIAILKLGRDAGEPRKSTGALQTYSKCHSNIYRAVYNCLGRNLWQEG